MTSPSDVPPSRREPVISHVLSAIARAEGVDEQDLSPPLGTVVDADALEAIAESATHPTDISFEYRQWLVELSVGQSVEVAVSRVDGERYECVCHSCGFREVTGGLRQAQESFNEHAAEGCEVVLRNASSSVESGSVDPVAGSDSSKDPSPAEE